MANRYPSMVGEEPSVAAVYFIDGDSHPVVLPSQLLKVHLAARQPTATTLRDSMKGNGTQAGT